MKLDDLGVYIMVFSGVILVGCFLFVFMMEQTAAIPLLVMGHAAAMLAAVGIKIGYILCLEEQSRNKRAHTESK